MTMLPTQKMQHQKVTLSLRPMKSAMGAAIRAPIKVPIESYHTSVKSYFDGGTRRSPWQQ